MLLADGCPRKQETAARRRLVLVLSREKAKERLPEHGRRGIVASPELAHYARKLPRRAAAIWAFLEVPLGRPAEDIKSLLSRAGRNRMMRPSWAQTPHTERTGAR